MDISQTIKNLLKYDTNLVFILMKESIPEIVEFSKVMNLPIGSLEEIGKFQEYVPDTVIIRGDDLDDSIIQKLKPGNRLMVMDTCDIRELFPEFTVLSKSTAIMKCEALDGMFTTQHGLVFSIKVFEKTITSDEFVLPVVNTSCFAVKAIMECSEYLSRQR